MASAPAVTWWLVDHGPWVWRSFVAACTLVGAALPGWWLHLRARSAARVARKRLGKPTDPAGAKAGAAACVRGRLRLQGGGRFDARTAPATLVVDTGGRSVELAGPFAIDSGTHERRRSGQEVQRSLGDGDEVLAAGTWQEATVARSDGGYRDAPESSFQIVAGDGRPVRLAAVRAPKVDSPHGIVRGLALAVCSAMAIALAYLVGALAVRAPSSSLRACDAPLIRPESLVALASPYHDEALRRVRDDLRASRYLPPAERARLLELDMRIGGCAALLASLEERRDFEEAVKTGEACVGVTESGAARMAFEAGWFDRASALYDRTPVEEISYGELERTVAAHLLAGRRRRAIDAARENADLLGPRDPLAPSKRWLPPPRLPQTPLRRERLQCIADALEARDGDNAALDRLRARKRPECQLLWLDALPGPVRRAELDSLGGRFAVNPDTPAQRRALELLLLEGDLSWDFAPPGLPADTSDVAWSLLSDGPRVLRDRVPAIELALAHALADLADPTTAQVRARITVAKTAAAWASLGERHDEAREWILRIRSDLARSQSDAAGDETERAEIAALDAAVNLRAGAPARARQAIGTGGASRIRWAVDFVEGLNPLPPSDAGDAWKYNPGWADMAPAFAARDAGRVAALVRCGQGTGNDLFALAAPLLAHSPAGVLDALRFTPEPRTAHTEGLYGHFTAVATRARLVDALGDGAWAAELRRRAAAWRNAMSERSLAIVWLVLWNQ